ncbi:uncharacterized protein [Medicago truncatula]|uniref:uncharacterized protein n=1 Tax=Medicago truncatula TaxID=3880 RepID=UPI000D2F27C5|nr:uncharacterized protein LOC112418614 [Medicago truncatula]
MGEKSWANVRALRAVLVLFESVSSLKVNFHKSMLSGINISDSWLGAATTALNCRVGRVPFTYLGLPVGGDSRRLAFWDPVVARIANKLSVWKSRFFSFGGRLILIKYALSSLPVYALSFFRAPTNGVALSVRFSRLYDLSVNKHCTVEEMATLGWEEGGDAWKWRRRLWYWEEVMVGECSLLLSNVVLQVSISDRWRWCHDISGCYSVRTAYNVLTSDVSSIDIAASDLIWHRHVPLKVYILAWCLLCNRLPAKANLMARGILVQDAQLCVSGCGEVETAQHLFVCCPIFGELWFHVRHWIGVSKVDPYDISDHFLQFTYLSGGAVSKRSFMQLLWLVCLGVVI